MSRFSPCRATTLEGVVIDCAGKCMNRGVRRNCPCANVRATSFPSLDSTAGSGLGPNGDEMAQVNLGVGRYTFFTDGSQGSLPRHATHGSGDEWRLVTTDPPAGSTYHAELEVVNNVSLTLVSAFSCEPLFNFAYTSIVEPGELISISFEAKKAGNYLSKNVQPNVGIIYRKADGITVIPGGTFFQAFSNLTTSYVTYSTSSVVPAQAVYADVDIARNESGSGGFGLDAVMRVGNITYSLV